MLVHHSRKQAGQKTDAEAARGGGAFVNAARSVLVLNRMIKQEGERFGIETDEQRRRYFTVNDDKHNRAPPEAAEWYRLVSVALGNGAPDGFGGSEGGDEVAAVECWTPPDVGADLDDATLRKIQKAIGDGDWKENVQAKAWAGHALAGVLGLDAGDPADKARLKALLKDLIKKGALRVEKQRDNNRKEREFVVAGTPVTRPQR